METALAGGKFRDCTKYGQVPVDELHLIENREDTVAFFRLTSATGGVKTQSFFDSFPSFQWVVPG
jgi:hypothetical protein